MKNSVRLAIMVALSLWSGTAMTEEGPKASAPLPPPLPAARSESSLPAIKAKPPDPATEEKGDSPRPEFDQPKIGSPQSKSVVPVPAGRTAHNKNARHPGGRAKAQAAGPVSRPALASGERRRNPPAALHQPGRLSPPSDLYPVPPVANAATAQAEPPRPPLLSFPEYPWRPPANGYYPYRWPPAGPAPLGSGY